MTDNITRIEAYCIDKRAGEALRALAGIVIEAKATPVANARVNGGTVVAAGNSDIATLFIKWAKKKKVANLPAAGMKEFCKAIGYSPGSSSYVTKKLVQSGTVKMVGKGSAASYDVKE